MHLLTISRRKIIGVSLAVALALVWGTGLAQDSGSDNLKVPRKREVDPNSRPNPNGEETKPPSEATNGASPADDEAGENEPLPDIRRRPPRTDDEEQSFKRFKFQTDPFLTVWDFSGQAKAYNPMAWLTGSSQTGLAIYIAQLPSGEVVGSLSIKVETVFDNEHGQMIKITSRQRLERALDTVVLVEPGTFRPIRLEQWDLGTGGQALEAGPEKNGGITRLSPPRFLAKYSFDRVDIERDQGDMISRARFRQLPYSFDRTSFVLVARSINFRFPDWPFEAPLTDPVIGAKILLSIPKPQRAQVLSAEPKTYNCYELKLQLGGLEETWWIERVPPNRLVKFTQDGKTFTLSQYLEQK